ncbi:hypothetical protein TNCV_2689951 [Trichonephila clavipes]|uniref:Uncharacterized protein n=1 Tax=Trichonephila clavipes TaxID=2585209 RepID=A0A8X6VYJ6_TRICX|nr:hypothetical protein TNCV_2689951 [Trichonephila clavipes]
MRHGGNKAINHELGYFVPLLQKSSFQFLESLWGVVGGQQLLFLERPKRALLDSCLENTLAIPFIEKEIVHDSIKVKSYPIAPREGNRDATIHQRSPTAKSGTFVHERRIIPTATVPPDENTPIIRMNRKTGLVRKKNIASFISPLVCMLCCPLPVVATMS